MKNNQSDENRYKDLQGYPLHKPLWQVFHQSAAANAIALTSVFAVAADALATGGLHIAQSILPLVPGFLVATATGVYLQNYALNVAFKNDLKKYAIDTQPDGRTPPTSAQNISKALITQRMFRSGIFIQLALDSLLRMPGILEASTRSKEEFAAIVFSKLSWAIPFYAVYCSAYLRFSKITNLDHAIVDPPAKKVEQKVEAGQQQTVFQPT